jgi:hypothetical protein
MKNVVICHLNRTTFFILYLFFITNQLGCMYMPAARDDLSVLGEDVFSNLIREAYSEKMTADKATGVGGYLGPSRINKTKANRIAQDYMSGQSVEKIKELFIQEGGRCSPIVLEPKRQLNCNIVRKWKLKNIGASIDTRHWPDPAAKLSYKFVLSESDTIANVFLEITDVTVYQPDHNK